MKFNFYIILINLLFSNGCIQSNKNWVVVKRYASGAVEAQNYEDTLTKIIYRREFYENGGLSATYSVSNGKLNGEFIRYHTNGQISLLCTMINSERHGLWSEYSDKGVLNQTTEYNHGVESGFQRIYSKNGNLLEEYYRIGKDVFYFREIVRDSIGKIINESEILKPKFQLPLDTLYYQDTLLIWLELPLPTPLFDLDSLTLHLAFVNKNTTDPSGYLDSSIFNEYKCPKKICLIDFIVNAQGENDLVGYYTQIVNGEEKEYKSFSIPVFIKNKRTYGNF
jgi:hypothetical protein